jgi:hypothetical protein
VDFLRRELIGGLSLILALAVFAGSDFRLTPPVIGLLALGGLWTVVVVAHALWKRRRPDEAPLSPPEPDTLTQLIGALKGGHILDARLQNSPRRDQAWHELCNEIDRWTFDAQQLLFNDATELLPHFDGDWKPNPLQSRDQISGQLQERLRELSEIVRKLRERARGE